MTPVPLPDPDRVTPSPTLRASALALLAPMVVLGISAWLRRDIPLNHDAAWFLLAAERLLDGGRYMTDFMEVNMPLAILAYVPPQWFSAATGLAAPAVNSAWTFALIAGSIGLVWRLARVTGGSAAAVWRSPWSLAWLAMVLALLPAYDFAEREHFAAVLLIPWLLGLTMQQPIGRSAAGFIAVAVGTLGCLIKPHFAPLALLLAALGTSSFRPRDWFDSPHVRLVVLLIVGNGLLVVLVFPEWLDNAGWARDLYGRFRGDENWGAFSARSSIVVALGTAALALLWAAAAGERRRLLPVLLCAAYAWGVYLLQDRGWRYHLIPAALFIAAALPLVASLFREGRPARIAGLARPVLLAALGVGLLFHVQQLLREAPRLSDLPRSPIGEALGIMAPGDRVFVFSTAGVPFFPAVTYFGLEWSSRYSSLWPLAALGNPSAQALPLAPERRRAYEAAFIASVVEDFERNRPDIAVVDLRPGQFGLAGRFDFIGFLSRDARFRDQWAHYVEIGRSRDYAIHARVQPARQPPPTAGAPAQPASAPTGQLTPVPPNPQ